MRGRRLVAWGCLALLLLADSVVAQGPDPPSPGGTLAAEEPITPIPEAPPADPAKLALGERLFNDHRLSHDGTRACSTCHDVHTNGADNQRTIDQEEPKPDFNTPTVFNAALNFRLNWEGNFRLFEAHVQASLENPAIMATSIDEVIGKLNTDPDIVRRFHDAYHRSPDRANLLDAIATFERSLLTPGSRFDRWLGGETEALTAEERNGYELFKSLGCVSCHQGVNVGGNLYQRHGIFGPLAAPKPEILRVPSLRNVASTAPYFHDGSAPTLDDAVRKMAAAQLDQDLSQHQIQAIVAFLGTLSGTFRGHQVVASSP